jgi:RDD family
MKRIAAMNLVKAAQQGNPRGSSAHEPQHEASLGDRLQALGRTAGLIVVTLVVGWLVWSVWEWCRGSTASYSQTGMRIVRRSTGQPIGLVRSLIRNALLCTLLLIPTIVVCFIVAVAFVMGASAPDGLLSEPRLAPWDVLTDTKVVRGVGRRGLRLAQWEDYTPVSSN